MKNKIKAAKIASILLCLCLACSSVALTGCSTNSTNTDDDNCSENVENSRMYEPGEKKPVIYIYSDKDNTPVDVSVELTDEVIGSVYPQNDNKLGDKSASWSVIANKDGTLKDTESGRELYSLYWESNRPVDKTYDIKTGYCIPGSDTEEFLYHMLKIQGLTDKEAEEFIIYWLPEMQNNKYNIISFDTTDYTKGAKLNISEDVDTLIRVNMTFKASDEPVELEPETYEPVERTGFTVVEWGGTEVE